MGHLGRTLVSPSSVVSVTFFLFSGSECVNPVVAAPSSELLLTPASAGPSLLLQQLLLIHATTPLLPPLLLCCATSPLSRDSASSSLYPSAVADRGDSNLTCPYCMVFGLTGAGCGDSSATGPRRPLQLLQPSRHSCFCRLVYQLSALTVPSTCGTRLLHFPAGVADRTCMQLSLCFLAIRFQALVVIVFTLRVPSVHKKILKSIVVVSVVVWLVARGSAEVGYSPMIRPASHALTSPHAPPAAVRPRLPAPRLAVTRHPHTRCRLTCARCSFHLHLL